MVKSYDRRQCSSLFFRNVPVVVIVTSGFVVHLWFWFCHDGLRGADIEDFL